MAQKAADAKRSIRIRKILTITTLLAMVLLIYFLREQISETLSRLDEVNVYILLFIIVWQIINYHTYAKLYQGLFDILGTKIKYKSMYKVSVELNFVNHVFPSAGVSGFSYFSLRMKQLGATAAQATLVQTMRFITVFLTFEIILAIGLLMLSIHGRASNIVILFASSLGTLMLVGTMLIIYVVGSRSRIHGFFTGLSKGLNKVIKLVRPHHPETINIASVEKLFYEFNDNYKILTKDYRKLKMPLVYAFFSSLTEIATIYTVYAAFGDYVNVGAVIIAYAVANFAGLISVLPGGIGVYEGLMTGVLAAMGVSPARTLPVTVMYRVLSMAVQLPPGYYLYHKALTRNDKPIV